MAKDMDSSNRMHHSNDALMDEAIARLEGIDSGRHRDTAKYKKVLEAIDELHRVSSPFYENPIGDKQNLEQIQQAYRELVSACDAYAEGKGDKRQSEFGTQRLNSIRAIRDLALKDSALLSTDHPSYDPSKKLGDLLKEARSITISVKDSKEITTVGAQTSSRIPLEIDRGNGPELGFFTESKENDTDDKIAESLMGKYKENAVMSPLYSVIEQAYKNGSISHILGAVDKIEDHKALYDTSGIKGIFSRMRGDDVMTVGLEEFRKKISEYANPVPGEFKSTDSFKKWITSDPSIVPALNEIYEEVSSKQLSCYNNHQGGIEDFRDVPSRNIGMSRCAELLGCQGLIAKADRMIIQIDGELKTGVFMEKAEGSDYIHLHQSDPLVTVFQGNDRGLEAFSGSFKRDLANIQVIDYICGNRDRHLGNMFYKTGIDENGQLRVTGVVGIDNDLSFGTIPGSQLFFRPENFRVMTRDTAMMVMSIDEAFLNNITADLDMGKDEKQQMFFRAMGLKRYLEDSKNLFMYDSSKAPEQQLPNALGKLIIVNDEKDLERIPFESLIIDSNRFQTMDQPDGRGNIFFQTSGIPKGVREKSFEALEQTPPIHYTKTEHRGVNQASTSQMPQQKDTGLSPDQKPLRFTPESVAAAQTFRQSTPQADTGLSPDQKPLRFTPESVAAAQAFRQSTPQADTGLSPDHKPLRFTPESVAAAQAFHQSTPQPAAQAPQQRDTGLSPDQKPLRFTPESVAAAKSFQKSTPQPTAQAPQQKATGLAPDQKPLRFTPESVAAAKESAKTSGPNEHTRTKIDLKTLEAKTPKSEAALRAEALAVRKRSRSYAKPPVPQPSVKAAAAAIGK